MDADRWHCPLQRLEDGIGLAVKLLQNGIAFGTVFEMVGHAAQARFRQRSQVEGEQLKLATPLRPGSGSVPRWKASSSKCGGQRRITTHLDQPLVTILHI